jgi:hypothetical protein
VHSLATWLAQVRELRSARPREDLYAALAERLDALAAERPRPWWLRLVG